MQVGETAMEPVGGRIGDYDVGYRNLIWLS